MERSNVRSVDIVTLFQRPYLDDFADAIERDWVTGLDVFGHPDFRDGSDFVVQADLGSGCWVGQTPHEDLESPQRCTFRPAAIRFPLLDFRRNEALHRFLVDPLADQLIVHQVAAGAVGGHVGSHRARVYSDVSRRGGGPRPGCA